MITQPQDRCAESCGGQRAAQLAPSNPTRARPFQVGKQRVCRELGVRDWLEARAVSLKELGEGRLRVPAEALLSSLISRQVTSLLLEERDNRKTEMFMHSFRSNIQQDSYRTALISRGKGISTMRGTQMTGPSHESCASSH